MEWRNEITNVIINGKDDFEMRNEAKFDLMDPNWGEDSNRTQAETQLDLRVDDGKYWGQIISHERNGSYTMTMKFYV